MNKKGHTWITANKEGSSMLVLIRGKCYLGFDHQNLSNLGSYFLRESVPSRVKGGSVGEHYYGDRLCDFLCC